MEKATTKTQVLAKYRQKAMQKATQRRQEQANEMEKAI
jgi:hypothetical protein